MFDFETAENLRNGAEILVRRKIGDRRLVVARWEKNPLPIVIWRVDNLGNAFWGHYFHDLSPALLVYADKIRDMLNNLEV